MSRGTALVTGASGGIGRSAVRSLAAAGWSVWVSGRDLDAARAVAGETGGRPLELDVRDAESIAAAVAEVSELDALVNNAGIQPDYGTSLLAADAELMRRSFETNVFGVVQVTNAFLPLLRRSASPRILNVSSGTASFAWSSGPNPQFDHESAAESGGRLGVYRTSKAALNMLTLLYAQALRADGFRVDALAPGARRTSLNPSTRGEDPAEAGEAVVRLLELSDDAPTGRLFSYDGTVAPW